MTIQSGVHDAEREGRLAEISERVRSAFPELSPPGLAAGYVAQYFLHVDTGDLLARSVDTQVGLVASHLRLGLDRQPDAVQLSVFTPSVASAGWSAGGSTVVQTINGDRRFLVNTVIMTITGLGWTIREVFHPQFATNRDDQGHFVGFVPADTPGAVRESWICLEVYPALGSAAADAAQELTTPLVRALELVAAAVADFPQMRERMQREIAGLAASAPGPDTTYATELLSWLAADNFVFLGFQEYAFDGDFRLVPGTGLGILRGDQDAPDTFHAYPDDDALTLVITKDTHFSPVHRRAYLEYVGIRRRDPAGRVVGEARFLGLFASSAYIESVYRIPGLRTKVEQLLAMSTFAPDAHGRSLLEIAIATYPRDELFQATPRELFPTLEQVSLLREKRRVRVFLRPSVYRQFVSVAVYLPRDRYVTSVRQAIQAILLEELGGLTLDHQVHLTESIMARLFFVVRVPGTAKAKALDVAALEARIAAVCRTWEDEFNEAAAGMASQERGVEFSESYQADYTAAEAVRDLRQLNRLADDDALEFALFAAEGEADCRLKVFAARAMSLAVAMPHLSALGVAVVDERPHDVVLRGRELKVYDFGLRIPGGRDAFAGWSGATRRRFVDAFAASYRGITECDQLNALVVSGDLSWRQVSWLRTISRYLQQANVSYSQAYIATALVSQVPLAVRLVALFTAKFDPDAVFATPAARLAAVAAAHADFLAALDSVPSLDHDRILRMFESVLAATVRTNAFADDSPAHALKLEPERIGFLPQPRPKYEIFVHSPRLSGTHLRFGKVARGGLRWSDRLEDFRTEVLGLAKAQVVKNAVIVPAGAKGGFVPLRLPPADAGRQAVQAEVVAAYRLFVSSLLSVTDNIIDGHTVPPPRVVTNDDPDPYLVVAADKGTASFSDIANEISVAHGFWLGDAFASGGSEGYDHQAMGITARGTWVSVRHHFAEMGIDCQTTDFTAVGIGDMSGDVFGNGMLQSRHTRLVAAFNHSHIFLDPDPDPQIGYEERRRLFVKPRSNWSDYNLDLLSPGGGVYERSAKEITPSQQARSALGIVGDATAFTPAELISAILQAPVDLMFNGGIGTYVKASSETHAEVGDRANDAVRIDAAQVRAKCVGEGGNLGWTQRARVEYALAGGRINTDFIDNSAGVDTSDHEVNIKILLGAACRHGELDEADRAPLLASMTEEVAQLVLAHNVAQNLILSDAERRADVLAGAHQEWIEELERRGLVDRDRDGLPSVSEMTVRVNSRRGLTRPELAVLLAHTKLAVKDEILAGDLPDDPYLAERLVTYFPVPVRERFRHLMPEHRLHREILTAVTVNRFVDTQGITAYHRLSQQTGSDAADVIRAQLAARALVDAAVHERRLTESATSAIAQTRGRVELRRMVERTSRVLLHTRRCPLDIGATVGALKPGEDVVRALLPEILTPRFARVAAAVQAEFTALGFAPDLVTVLGSAQFAHFATGIVQIPRGMVPLEVAAEVFFEIAQRLSLDALHDQVDVLPRAGRWDTMARAALRDDLLRLLGQITAAVLAGASGTETAAELVDEWMSRAPRAQAKAKFLAEAVGEESSLAQVTVGLRQARSLIQGEE